MKLNQFSPSENKSAHGEYKRQEKKFFFPLSSMEQGLRELAYNLYVYFKVVKLVGLAFT